jgi:hypothetical protein
MTEFQQARRKVVVSTVLASTFLVLLAAIAAWAAQR